MSSSYQEDSILGGVREELSQEIQNNPYEEYNLLSNPFPIIGEFCGNCVDQKEVKGKFKQELLEFNRNAQSRIMTMIGGTGAGKTNLLRYFEQTLNEWREPNTENKAITDLFTVYVDRPQGNYLEIHRQIISQFATMFFTKFFTKVRESKTSLSKLPEELPGTNPELIRALVHISQRDSGQMSLLDEREQTYSVYEPQSYRILDNWLQGIKLNTGEKKLLGNVSADVSKSSTVAIKFLSDLVKIFLHVELFKGVIIFIDELEEVFSGLSSTSQAQYAQDLRNLIDSHPNGIVFVVGTAPIAERLQQISPALLRRLGETVTIAPISDEDLALEYAQSYIQSGRAEFKDKRDRQISLPDDIQNEDKPYYPLTKSKVIEVYDKLSKTYGSENIIPGSLLPELNLLLYKHVYEEK